MPRTDSHRFRIVDVADDVRLVDLRIGSLDRKFRKIILWTELVVVRNSIDYLFVDFDFRDHKTADGGYCLGTLIFFKTNLKDLFKINI